MKVCNSTILQALNVVQAAFLRNMKRSIMSRDALRHMCLLYSYLLAGQADHVSCNER